MRENIKTTLYDDRGKPHQYDLIQHPATSGCVLFQRVLKALSMPAGKAITALQGNGQLPTDMAGFIALISDDGVKGDDIGSFFLSVATELGVAGPDLFAEALRHTSRDGVQFKNELAFNQAFTGNYGEMMKAVAWALKENFGDVMDAMQSDFSQAS